MGVQVGDLIDGNIEIRQPLDRRARHGTAKTMSDKV